MTPIWWSVGDIIDCIHLIIASIDAAKDNSGSAAEFRAISSTLAQVAATLEGLNKLKIQDPAEQLALHVSASKCGETIYQFLNKINKFKPGLGTRHSIWKLHATLRKIEWARYRNDLAHFQALLLADLCTLILTQSRVLASISGAQATETQLAIVRVEQKLDQNTGICLLLVQALKRCFLEFRPLLLFLFLGNIRVIGRLLSGPQLTPAPEETPIYLDDPNRRVLKFLRSSIRDWDDFETLLKILFKREAGLQKITAGEYVLHDAVRNKDVTKAMPFERVFLPGKKLSMSIVFQLGLVVGKCPRCSGATIQSVRSDWSELKCDDCELTYSKGSITTLENENGFARESPPPTHFRAIERQSRPAAEDPVPGPTPPEDSIHDFARVRIIENLLKSPNLNSRKRLVALTYLFPIAFPIKAHPAFATYGEHTSSYISRRIMEQISTSKYPDLDAIELGWTFGHADDPDKFYRTVFWVVDNDDIRADVTLGTDCKLKEVKARTLYRGRPEPDNKLPPPRRPLMLEGVVLPFGSRPDLHKSGLYGPVFYIF